MKSQLKGRIRKVVQEQKIGKIQMRNKKPNKYFDKKKLMEELKVFKTQKKNAPFSKQMAQPQKENKIMRKRRSKTDFNIDNILKNVVLKEKDVRIFNNFLN